MSDSVPGTRESAPVRTLVLGLGNDILTDDSVGLRVAAALQTRVQARSDITVLQTAEMGLALLDIVTGYKRLVLVDAVQTGQSPPGFVHEIDGADLSTLPAVSPHFLGVGEAFALGRKLGFPVPSEVRIFAIEVQDPFTVGTELTPALSSALAAIVQRVEAAL